MDTTKLNISFKGTDSAAVKAVLKSAEIIITYSEFKESKNDEYSATLHPQTVVSFVGMLQEMINKSGGSVAITNSKGDVVNLTKGKDFHFGELEKQLQPML
jgi:hypothetical protein